MRLRWPVAAAAIALLGAACSDSDGGIPEAEVTDSAGVRIMAYDLGDVDVPVAWIVGSHDVEIGQVDGAPEYAFSRITDMAVTSDGWIVVSDGATQELRVYNGSGAYVRTIGQWGDGPGEFSSSPLIAGLDANAVFAYDGRASRLTQFSLDGDLIETVTLGADQAGRPASVLRFADGTYLARSPWVNREMSPHEPRLELDSIVIEHLDPIGALIDTVHVMADRTRARAVQARPNGQVAVIQGDPPFGSAAVVRTDGARTVVGHGDAFEFTWRSLGDTTVLRVAGVANPATAQDIRAYQEATVREEIGDGELDPMTRQLLFDFLPDRLPAFGEVVVSDDDHLWVSLTEFDSSEGLEWLVFEPTGELKGTVRTPPELQIRSVSGGSIIGVVLDEFDVPYVRRYPLHPGLS
jgi:hypothetical protein